MKLKMFASGVVLSLLISPMVYGGEKHKSDKEYTAADFRQAAKEYSAEARKYHIKGDSDIAVLYERLSAIKMEAAPFAQRWEDFDWSEYMEIKHEIDKKIEAKKGHPGKKGDRSPSKPRVYVIG